MKHIQTVELASSQANVTFNSIPQEYDDLILFSSARTDRASEGDAVEVSFNGADNTNEDRIQALGNGSTTSSASVGSVRVAISAAANATSGVYGNSQLYINNYTSSNSKTMLMDGNSENNATTAFVEIHFAEWNDSNAITSITLGPSNGTVFTSGTTFSLYGVSVGGDGTVTTA